MLEDCITDCKERRNDKSSTNINNNGNNLLNGVPVYNIFSDNTKS
jgi:hypothetical protein